MADLADAIQALAGVPATIRVGVVAAVSPLTVSIQGAALDPQSVGVIGSYMPKRGDTVAVIGQSPQNGPDPETWLVLGSIATSGSGGLRLLTTVRYTSPGTHNFVKADYTGIRAVNVRCWGGGGAGGGRQSGVTRWAGGGGGGGYGERLIFESVLNATEVITVGAGGTGVSAGNGNAGGLSRFGTTHNTQGNGGGGGLSVTTGNADGGAGGTALGAFTQNGQGGEWGRQGGDEGPNSGSGGATWMGWGEWGRKFGLTGGGGQPGGDPSRGGGGGGALGTASSQPGGNGGNGQVIVEVYI